MKRKFSHLFEQMGGESHGVEYTDCSGWNKSATHCQKQRCLTYDKEQSVTLQSLVNTEN